MSGVVVSHTDLITFNRSFLNIYCFYEVIYVRGQHSWKKPRVLITIAHIMNIITVLIMYFIFDCSRTFFPYPIYIHG